MISAACILLKQVPFPVYRLTYGKDIPPDILQALKDKEETAVLLNSDGDPHSVVLMSSIGIREMDWNHFLEQYPQYRELPI